MERDTRIITVYVVSGKHVILHVKLAAVNIDGSEFVLFRNHEILLVVVSLIKEIAGE